jgi:hypothetical protein
MGAFCVGVILEVDVTSFEVMVAAYEVLNVRLKAIMIRWVFLNVMIILFNHAFLKMEELLDLFEDVG